MLRITYVLTPATTWPQVLMPLFISDALNTYFCIIVLVCMYLYHMLRPAMLRTMWSIAMIGLYFIFKFLLCRKLEAPESLEYSVVLAPIFTSYIAISNG